VGQLVAVMFEQVFIERVWRILYRGGYSLLILSRVELFWIQISAWIDAI